jgi:hypothetical protein
MLVLFYCKAFARGINAIIEAASIPSDFIRSLNIGLIAFAIFLLFLLLLFHVLISLFCFL